MAWRSLLREPPRLLLSALTVATAIALILVFEGFRVGLHVQVSAFPRGLPADLVATQAGVSNMIGARSILPQGVRAAVAAVPGVRAVHPLAGVPVIYSAAERSVPIYVVAYDTAGGPRRLLAGHEIADVDEVVVDAGLAARFALAPGSRVTFLGHDFTVAGVAAGTNFLDPYVFVRLTDMLDLYLAGTFADLPLEAGLSYLLIEVAPDADLNSVRTEIRRRVNGVDVLTPAQLAENDARRVDEFLGAPLDVLVTVAFAAGVLVVGLTLYVSVLGRMREFGVMKAIGAGRFLIARHIALEVALVSALALVMGVVLAAAIAALLARMMPQYLVLPLGATPLLRTIAATVAMAGVGALLPTRRLGAVDPASVFAR
jgi:putative ABC transport system permease protein